MSSLGLWQFLETMAEVIKEGITKAQEDLEKETLHKVAQEVRAP